MKVTPPEGRERAGDEGTAFSKTNSPGSGFEAMHDKASYGWSLGALKAKVL
jgi:hypothetical protein